jgi:alanyl-tRNA synthetase
VPSRFVGYDTLETHGEITALLKDGRLVEELVQGEEGQLLLDVTPFYAESGGQVADHGWIRAGDAAAEVLDVQKAPHGQHVHTIQVTAGRLRVGDAVSAEVATDLRRDTIKNHTATHLLHKALREVLGEHVAQAGSLVAPDRLRFDFSHFGPLSEQELAEVERRVNEVIWRDEPVEIFETDLDTARRMGAMALFGEKYGQRVRVVKAGDYSIELCGGCHVERTGLIGLFRIVSEAGIGSGVRRIEAVTGRHAYRFVQLREGLLHQAAIQLKTTEPEVPARLERVLEDMRRSERELESARARLNHARALELVHDVKHIGDIPVLAAIVPDSDMEGLRQIVDELRTHLPSHVIVLGTAAEGRVQLVAAVSKDLQQRRLHAGQIVKKVAELTGGGGGGRPDLAQAGGKDPEALPGAIAQVSQIVQELAGNTVV